MKENNDTDVLVTSDENQEKGLTLRGVQINSVITTNASELARILMENIEKVKADPKFIPQAEAVNNQIKSMIELGKAEIEMLKVTAFMGR